MNEASLVAINAARLSTTFYGMSILAAWGIGNVLVAVFRLAQKHKGRIVFFHLTNALWNVANLVLAAVGLIFSFADPAQFNFRQTIVGNYFVQNVVLFSMGLDVAFIALAGWLIEKGKSRSNADRWIGIGQSILLQGTFLLVFDTCLFFAFVKAHQSLLELF